MLETSLVLNFNSKGVIPNKEILKTIPYFLALILSIASVKFLKKKSKNRTEKLVEMFPGIKKYGGLGSLPEMYFLALDPAKKFFGWMETLTKVHGPVLKFWMLNVPKVFIVDPEIALKLYKENSLMDKPSDVTKSMENIGAAGLAACRADIHRIRRKQWMPSFNRKQIEQSITFFRQQSIRLCHELTKFENNGQEFDLVNLSINCTFNAICYSAFGEEYMSRLLDSVGKDHIHDLHTVSLNLTSREFKPWAWNDFIYFNLIPAGRETMKSVKRANLFAKQAVIERQKHLQSLKTEPNNNETPGNMKEYKCFLDNMLELMNNGQLTEKEVIQELNVFIAAGYDTSGITLCYTLHLLSLHPDHQDRIVEELCQVIPQEYWHSMSRYDISVDSINQMKYLELCVKEALRLYPVAPVSPRRTTNDVKLPDGKIIPEGVDVYVMLNMILRNPKYFEEPDQFIPKRHLTPSPAFIPFSFGRRNCIGQKYAMYEMKVVLAYLLMSYKWENAEKGELKTIFQTLQVPEKGVHFKVTKREFQL